MNGRVVETGEKPDTGQMLVPVDTGRNRVKISFVRTWDRAAGGWISLITVILLSIRSVLTNLSRPQASDLGPRPTGSEVGLR